MKGIAPIAVALVAVVALLVIGGFMANTLMYRIESMTFTLKDIYVVSAINRFETIKIGLPYAANYSFCQALYEVSKEGGVINPEKSYDGIAIWKDDSDVYIPDYQSNITFDTKNIFEEYLSSIEDLSHSPYRVYMQEDDDKVFLDFNSSGLIEYSSPVVLLRLKQKPNISVTFDTQLKKMYKLGRDFVNSNQVTKAVEDTLNELDSKCKSISIGDICEKDVNPEGKLNEVCPKIDENLKNSLINKLSSLNQDDGSLSLIVDGDKSSVSHSSTYTYSSSESSDQCGGGNLLHNVVYDYSYTITARALVSIEDKENSCPAYDGKTTDYRHTVLNFYVIINK